MPSPPSNPAHRPRVFMGVKIPFAALVGTRAVVWLGLFLVAWWALDRGLEVRRWTWDMTEPVHFQQSMNNAIRWGTYANYLGYVEVYQKLIDEVGKEGEPRGVPLWIPRQGPVMAGPFALDYPPLRLQIARHWADWAAVDLYKKRHPVHPPEPPLSLYAQFCVDPCKTVSPSFWDAGGAIELYKNQHASAPGKNQLSIPAADKLPEPQWQNTYEFNRPMLELNNICELAAAIGMFLLVHHWICRCDREPDTRNWIRSLFGRWTKRPPSMASLPPAGAASAHMPAAGAALGGAVNTGMPSADSASSAVAKPLDYWKAPVFSFHDAWERAKEAMAHYCRTTDWLSLRGVFAGFAAALLLWFNPAVIFNAHGYPQWDVRLLPFFIFAVYCALRNWWLVAGLLVGIESMAKGQILMVAPVILLWPLINLRFWAIYRAAVGFALGVAIIVQPWLMIDPASLVWARTAMVGAALLLPLFFLRRRTVLFSSIRYVLGSIAVVLIVWTWLRPQVRYVHFLWWWPRSIHFPNWDWSLVSVIGGLAVLSWVAARYLPWRAIPTWIASAAALGLWLCLPVFNGNMAWYDIGIVYPQHHWKQLAHCKPSNLGAILQVDYDWAFHDQVDLFQFTPTDFIPHFNQWTANLVTHHHWLTPMHDYLTIPRFIEIRSLMILCFVIGLIVCAVAVARHVRWNDRRFLYALFAPWLLLFAVLPQMQDRYMVWAAGLSAAIAAISIEGLLIYLAISWLCVIMMMHWMIGEAPWAGRLWSERLSMIVPTFPGIGWGVLLLTAVSLYLAVLRTKRPKGWGLGKPGGDAAAAH